MKETVHDLTYCYYRKAGARTAYLVLHGGNEGISSPFISSILNALKEGTGSVFGFNFPYCERRDGNTSGPKLIEEVNALSRVISFLCAEGHQEFVIIAKSLGGIVASFWLTQNPQVAVRVIILGYVIGSVKTEAFACIPLAVIQGQCDRFGDAAKVREELATQHITSADIIEMPNADHSYRDPSGQPTYQPHAIKQLIRVINGIASNT